MFMLLMIIWLEKELMHVNDSINAIMNVQDSDVTDIVEQPFATMGNRKLDDISKPRDKDEDKDLPF